MELLITALTLPLWIIIEIAVHVVGEPNKRYLRRTLED